MTSPPDFPATSRKPSRPVFVVVPVINPVANFANNKSEISSESPVSSLYLL